jgi:hypothetical protein
MHSNNKQDGNLYIIEYIPQFYKTVDELVANLT